MEFRAAIIQIARHPIEELVFEYSLVGDILFLKKTFFYWMCPRSRDVNYPPADSKRLLSRR